MQFGNLRKLYEYIQIRIINPFFNKDYEKIKFEKELFRQIAN